MELSEIYAQNHYGTVESFAPKLSFDICAPSNNDISELFENLRVLKKYNPVLISMTSGTNGGLNRFSPDDIRSIRDLEYSPVPVFDRVSMLKSEGRKYITQTENLGIENIMVSEGHLPDYIKPSELDFKSVQELVSFIEENSTLSIGAIENIENISKNDINNLKQKIDAGVCVIFTLPFFDNEKFYRYIDIIRKAGINIPVIAGILPVNNTSTLEFSIPAKLKQKLEKYPKDTEKTGVEFAIEQSQNLIEQEVAGLHFYTMNKTEQISKILDEILY